MTDNRLRLSLDYSPTLLFTWQRDKELPHYETFYDQTDLCVGFLGDWGRWNELNGRTYYNLSFHWSQIRGRQENDGSRRDLLGIEVGGIQFLGENVFLALSLIPAYANSKSNFGDGFPLRHEDSFNVKLKGILGVQHCFNPYLCPGLYVSAYADKTVAGAKEGNHSHGMSGGFTWSGALEAPPPKVVEKLIPYIPPEPGVIPPSLDFGNSHSKPFKIPAHIKDILVDFAQQLRKNGNETFTVKGNCTLSDDKQQNILHIREMVDAISKYLTQELIVPTNQLKIGTSNSKRIGSEGEIVYSKGISIGQAVAKPGAERRCWVTFEKVKP